MAVCLFVLRALRRCACLLAWVILSHSVREPGRVTVNVYQEMMWLLHLKTHTIEPWNVLHVNLFLTLNTFVVFTLLFALCSLAMIQRLCFVVVVIVLQCVTSTDCCWCLIFFVVKIFVVYWMWCFRWCALIWGTIGEINEAGVYILVTLWRGEICCIEGGSKYMTTQQILNRWMGKH